MSADRISTALAAAFAATFGPETIAQGGAADHRSRPATPSACPSAKLARPILHLPTALPRTPTP